MQISQPLLPLIPGAKAVTVKDNVAAKSIFSRDGYACRFCGVAAAPLCAETEGGGSTSPAELFGVCMAKDENLSASTLSYFRAVKLQLLPTFTEPAGDEFATACPVCFSLMDLQSAARRNVAVVIWCPELTQVELQNMCFAFFDCVVAARPESQQCIEIYDALMRRAEAVEQEWGKGSTRIEHWAKELAAAAQSPGRRLQQFSNLKGVRFLPLAQAYEAYFRSRWSLADRLNLPNDIHRASWSALTPAADARREAAELASTIPERVELAFDSTRQARSAAAAHAAVTAPPSQVSASGAPSYPSAALPDHTGPDVAFLPDADDMLGDNDEHGDTTTVVVAGVPD